MKKLERCLFEHLIGNDPELQISQNVETEMHRIRHDEARYMTSYFVTDEFLWNDGINEFNELSSLQKTLMAKDFIYTKDVLKKKPVLASTTIQSAENYHYFSVAEYENRRSDNTLKYDAVLSSINSISAQMGIGNLIEIAPIFKIQNQISNNTELKAILSELKNDGMIFFEIFNNTSFFVAITAKGAKYSKEQSLSDSKKVFVAAQFNWAKKESPLLTDKNFEDFLSAIKRVCISCGYVADIVNQDHTNYITDEIIKGIRESRFVISDFTFNNSGVYFESGFARGIEKSVIHTVHSSHISDLHFDIKQINYIEWDDLKRFEENLYNRIKAMNL